MVKSRYSILFPTSFFVTLLGNSKCVNSFPSSDGCRWAWERERETCFIIRIRCCKEHKHTEREREWIQTSLTRNWSLWRSDSGVKELDMGRICPARMIRALKHTARIQQKIEDRIHWTYESENRITQGIYICTTPNLLEQSRPCQCCKDKHTFPFIKHTYFLNVWCQILNDISFVIKQ